MPSIGLLDRDSALDNPELRQFFARAAPNLHLDLPELRAELRRQVRLPTAAIAEVWRLAIGSGAVARRVRVPTLILQDRPTASSDHTTHARSPDGWADPSTCTNWPPVTCSWTRRRRPGSTSVSSW